MIVSRKRVVYFDPQQKIWGNSTQSGHRYKLRTMQRKYSDSLLQLDGIDGFRASGMSDYPYTLFRFPLRFKPSQLSANTPGEDESIMQALIKAFREEAEMLLIFLRSVESIAVYTIDITGSKSLYFSVEVAKDAAGDAMREKRRSFKAGLEESFQNYNCYGLGKSLPIAFTSKFDIAVRVAEKDSFRDWTSTWLVSNQVGSNGSSEVIAAANELHVFPWVGTALSLSTKINYGRIFCVLPLPVEAATHLPVHVNATFSLEDSRRSLKEPQKEREHDTASNWNKLLVREVIPSCYISLLQEALKHMKAKQFYDAIPDIAKVSNSMWVGLVQPLCSEIFTRAWLWSLNERWIRPNQATFVPRDEDIGDTVLQVLGACGYDIVTFPSTRGCSFIPRGESHMWRALDMVSKPHPLTEVNPELAKEALRAHRSSYIYKNAEEKLVLLQYCLSSSVSHDSDEPEDFSGLNDLHLLPLASGDFVAFNSRSQNYNVYVCSEKYPQELLPDAERFLLDRLHTKPTLCSLLESVASSKQTQLRMLDAEGVAKLLPEVLPNEWSANIEQGDPSLFPHRWFELFWKWVKSQKLCLFLNKFVVPILSQSYIGLSVMKLEYNSPIVYVKKDQVLSEGVESVLSKLGIRHTSCDYLQHRDVMKYLQPLTPDGVLAAISRAAVVHPIRSVSFTRQEAIAFQEFLASAWPNRQLSQHRKVLEHLSIFLSVDISSAPLSLRGSSQQSKRLIMEPSDILHAALPSSLVVLSNKWNKQSLLQISPLVKFPESMPELLKDYVFPHIEDIARIKLIPLMQEVLLKLSYFESTEILTADDLAGLQFIPHGQKLVRPDTLYDPSKIELRDIFRGESAFPVRPFNEECYLEPLRRCGLKGSVTSRDLYSILRNIAASKSLTYVGEVKSSRVRAVFRYIKDHAKVLDDVVSINQLSLKESICNLAKQKSILPVESTPPDDYPVCLPWKGSFSIYVLSRMNDSVQLCTERNKVHYSNLVGSQMYMFYCSSEVYSAFDPRHPVSDVVGHLMEVIKHEKDFKRGELVTATNKIYRYLENNLSSLIKIPQNFLTSSKWVWHVQEKKFIQPTDIAFGQHPDFHSDLSPYIFILPSDFDSLFTRYGAHREVTDDMLISVLERVQLSEPRSWSIVNEILKWLTNDRTAHVKEKVSDLSSIYVPVKSSSRLVKVEDVTYVDRKYMKHALFTSKAQKLKIIHDKCEHLAEYLGVTSLSKRLGISQDLCGDISQSEPLVKRLKTILRDYECGLTIIKELIQNADDAGASEVNICYDARQHVVDENELRFPGMSKAHGPALIFHNDKTFSDKDFENIQQLAGATKKDEPLKIGKFGVGFCSVYHITDVPSFVSRDWLYIFDPELEYLKEEIIDPLLTGKKLCFTEDILPASAQMTPYIGLFGFEANKPYNGTIFRLPFRTKSSHISGIRYDENEIAKLQDQVEKAGSKLLIFLKNIKSITFSRINEGETEPQVQLRMSKSVVHYLVKPTISISSSLEESIPNCLVVEEEELEGSDENGMLGEEMQYEYAVLTTPREEPNELYDDAMPCEVTTKYGYEDALLIPCDSEVSYEDAVPCIEDCAMLTPCTNLYERSEDGMPSQETIKDSFSTPSADFFNQDEHVTLSACDVQVSVTNLEGTTNQHWLIAQCKDIYQVSAVACSLEEKPTNSERRYFPQPVIGEVFCFLPLHMKTGLPVHVSANFAVTNDRKGIHCHDTLKSEQSEFNVTLMKTTIPRAYHKLLSVLVELCDEGRVTVNDYVFHSLWPAKSLLETHNPWDYFVPEVYKLISEGKLCYSKVVMEWKHLSECKVVPKCILKPAQRADVMKILTILRYPLIEIPFHYHDYLEREIGQSTISEVQFLADFFENIGTLPIVSRNYVLLSLVTTFIESTNEQSRISSAPQAAVRSTDLRQFIESNSCIPCSPEGNELKKCCQIIDHRSKFEALYNPQEGIFVADVFRVPIVLGALQELGMVSNKLPWDMVIERAKTVGENYKADKTMALRRAALLLRCIEENLASQSEKCLPPEGEELCTIPFLPVLQRPQDYPQELDWEGDGGDGLLSSCKVLMGVDIPLLAGSTVSIVSCEPPHNGGCGELSLSLARTLSISLLPTVNDVLQHLVNIASMNCKDFAPWVNSCCRMIYNFIDTQLKTQECMSHVKATFYSLPEKLVWTGKEFIHPSSIAQNWHHDGPCLFPLPSLLKSGLHHLVKTLDLKEDFETDQILDALAFFKDHYSCEDLPGEMVVDVVEALARSIGDTAQPGIGVFSKPCYLPDEKLHMRELQDLAWNDAPWCTPNQEVYFLYDKIPRCTALKLGVKPVRSVALDPYSISSELSEIEVVEFGQHEQLTQRIKNVLDSYSHNETVLKELLQNADDAKASKLYVILDEREHRREKIFSDAWGDLQGPALLVWNDQGFTQENFAGIQKLGLGSKRSKSESIGQFGIGFNVVYHFTDCPSFFTNGDTLCILDPHCRYAPGATETKPGTQMNKIDEKFWDTWCDLRSAYLREGLECPDEISKGGTLFRFPLRCTEHLVKMSELVDDECMPYTSSMMEKHLEAWAPRMKETLLFLKHVRELRFFVIKEDATEMFTTHHFKADFTEDAIDALQAFQGWCTDFSDHGANPHVVSYTLKLIEMAPVCLEETWFVQQGVGDIQNPLQKWEFLTHMKPTHGIAAKIRGSTFEPKIFCFLPLAHKSKLPVHINGNFTLDSSSRSDLWNSRDSLGLDSNAQWNNMLIEAIGSSYADFLIECQSIMVHESYAKRKDLSLDIERYYGLFPKWQAVDLPPESNMLSLAKHTYRILDKRKSKILVIVRKPSTSSSAFQVYWQSVQNEDSSKQVYFWPHKLAETTQATSEPQSRNQLGFKATDQHTLKQEADLPLRDCEPFHVPAENVKSVSSLQTTPDGLNMLPIWDSPVQMFTDHKEDKAVIPPILKRLGILLTAAPDWIRMHFDSVNVNVPEATPESVLKYFSEHSSQACHSAGSFPCKLKETIFGDVDSFKVFLQYITVEMPVTDDSGKVSLICRKLVSELSPFGLPLLLTADKFLRIFLEEDKVISSKFCDIFPNRGDKFLHRLLVELNFDPCCFLNASPGDQKLVRDILGSTLNDSLCCRRLKYASSFINIKEMLGPLWKCLCEDPGFRVHANDIVENWALILSEKDEVFRFDPQHSYLMPVAPPRKPKHLATPSDASHSQVPSDTSLSHTSLSQEEESEEEEYLFLFKLFEIFKANGMPCVHNLVRKVKYFCPIFLKPESILTNLYHLYNERRHFDAEIYDNIAKIFSYFSRINFVQEEENLKKIKSLPLFKSVQGIYCCLPEEAYFWPEHICMKGIDKILTEVSTAVFLSENGNWHTLSNADTLGLRKISPMMLYVKFLFPHFHLLTEEECLIQLEHIRDTRELFQTAAECNKEDSDPDLHLTEKMFFQALKELPMLAKNGELASVGDFCHPYKAIFDFFPGNYAILPEKLRTDKWLPFLEIIGLQKQPSPEDYEQFCQKVSGGHHYDIKGASRALLRCLFEVHKWHNDEEFLHRIRSIPFVCVQSLEEHSRIFPACCAGVLDTYQEDGTRVQLTCLENCATFKRASVIWTVFPVVHLPDVTLPPISLFLHPDARKACEAMFMKHLGVLVKPAVTHVVENIFKFSQSHFSNFELFESYSQECIYENEHQKKKFNLVSIVTENLEYLDKTLTRGSKNISLDVSCLQHCSCIPVSSDYTGRDMSRPVLVKPLQVVCNLDEESRSQLHPFMCGLPNEVRYMKVLGYIGLNSHPEVNNVLHALQLVKSHVVEPIDHSAARSVKHLLILLYRLLTVNKDGLGRTKVLYLPSRDHKLLASTELIYNDLDLMLNEGAIPNCQYAVVSLLCDKFNEIEEYGFRLSDFLSKLPQHLQPIPLSKHCCQKLHHSCNVQQTLSQFACQLNQTFQQQYFIDVVEHVLCTKNAEQKQACSRFISSLRTLVKTIEVVTVVDLMVSISYDEIASIGTASTDFLLEWSDQREQNMLYVDAQPLMFTAHERVVKCITNGALKKSGIPSTALAMVEAEYIMGVMLSGGTIHNVRGALVNMYVNPSTVKLDKVFSYDVCPVIGADIPEELCHRLRSDINNRFKPMELVGYKGDRNRMVFARVEYRSTNNKDGKDKMDEYVISIGDGIECTVSVMDLYKILCIKDKADGEDLELYDPTPGAVELWDSIGNKNIEDIKEMVSEEVHKIIKLCNNKCEKDKALRAMRFKWHPSNSNHPLAAEAFQFLEKQLEEADALDAVKDQDDAIYRWRENFEKEVRTRHHIKISDPLRCQLMASKSLAKVWIKQAKHDKRAMEVINEAAKNNEEQLCAHVCFLAHQVVEKALKAGMYASVGLGSDDLRSHILFNYAKAIQQEFEDDFEAVEELPNLVRYFVVPRETYYYLAPRYPNQCSNQTPSELECFQLKHVEAFKKSSDIFDIVYKLLY